MNEILLLFLLLVLSGFFSGSETALTAISSSRVEALAAEGRSGAQALAALKSNTERMLATLLIGNNLVNIGASAIATVLATDYFGHFGPGLAVGGLTLFILVFGEVLPKTYAARHKVPISLAVAPPLFLFSKLVYPLAWGLEHLAHWSARVGAMTPEPTVTESELISLARHGALEGTIEPEEEELIQRVFSFNDLTAADVMTPRHMMAQLSGALTIKEALPDLLNLPYSRIPLYAENRDEITRVVYAREVLEAIAAGDENITLMEAGHEPVFVPLNQPLDDMLKTLRVRKQRLIIVVDDLGAAQGLVTLEDVIEELVGEITDEDELPPVQQMQEMAPGRVLVDGAMELRHLESYFETDLSGKPTDRVSQWLLSHVERLPHSGEEFTLEGMWVRVEKCTRRRILKVVVERAQAPVAEEISPLSEA
ncbi:hemolysin family protein [Magnetofaba australis]|uniref:HlyC/CorC family transporter n=1 Tax=Magnetofaba australis IT-1 TaxID=1434232 RepID=A0A1Y2K100_9PROT|nr:hemolysin family protein [Magnetofaba australis]OSM01678.1 hypothetical protein MAIT1_01695 [Magnetofaba australis IT-1]